MATAALSLFESESDKFGQTRPEADTSWYAAYTCANHERKVASQMEQRGLESFLPLYETVRRWKDRKMRLQLPLFPGYVFVRMSLRQRLRVLQIHGVARLVGFGERVNAQPHPYLTAGCIVRVIHGPLAGMEGVLLRTKGAFRLILSIDLIMKSIIVDVDAADVRRLNTEAREGKQGVGCTSVLRFA
jgi:transcription antitermination factor NusG